MSTAARLKFTMYSNLVIVANFRDIARPVNVITSPTVGQTVTNNPASAQGRAKDNVGVSNVWVQLNGGGWTSAASSNAFTNWSTTNLILFSGANLIQAYAVDGAGNASLTNSVKLNFRAAPAADWAPDSLNGLLVQVRPFDTNEQPESVGFDITTFAQAGENGDTNAGNYFLGAYRTQDGDQHGPVITDEHGPAEPDQ